jgi:CheY-like chemotaxis protein
MSKEIKKRILLVEDEELNRKIIKSDLKQLSYDVVLAENGKFAVDILRDDNAFDVIILDRMMPQMDGMEVLSILQNDNKLNSIPVVMQTAAASSEQVKEGIESGVFYYLTKPFSKDVLLSIVQSAIRDKEDKDALINKLSYVNKTLELMDTSSFRFKTIQDCNNIAHLIASACPYPQKVVVGLAEMMINAVEHGNLNITYEEKKELICNYGWLDEVNKRLKLDAYKNLYANINFERREKEIKVIISDSGNGFNWRDYIVMQPHRVTDPNGRGIIISKTTSFDYMQYNEIGNEVCCTINLN